METKLNTRDNPQKCAHPDCTSDALTLADYCWYHLPDKREYLEKLKEWINIHNEDLQRFILERINLTEYPEFRDMFEGANLQEANLGGAKLQKANLRQANLQGANLFRANLQKVSLVVANLQEADLGFAKLQKADLQGANLQKADLRGANLQKAKLWGANLQKANLWLADLQVATLREVKLQKARLILANLEEAILSKANLQKADFLRANLQKADFWRANLQKANLRRANLQKADLREANFQKANFSYAHLSQAEIDWGTILTEANLAFATLTGVKTITHRNFLPKGAKDKLTEKEKEEAEAYKESYLTIKNYFLQIGRYDDASWAAFREKTLERKTIWNKYFKKHKDLKEKLKKTKWWKKRHKLFLCWVECFLRALFSRWSIDRTISLLCGYGEKPRRPLISAGVIIISFAFLFWAFKWVITDQMEPLSRFWDYLYFSGITFTTIGYGDMRPLASPWARLIAFGEGFIGVFLIAIFVWTLGRRYSGR